ncbi:MAG TPA: multicopper oxidase domain-containing protein [Candidatus Thermoplasmatota archaeon]|nr:multicopper oxidase domain-containing protein [Candidatus Thermoplasmatota archaeon]
MRRLSLPFTMVAVALLVAGCTTEGVQTASTQSKASKVNALLAAPPGSDVEPTGVVRDFTLYVHRMMHEVYPGASMQMWGFSLSEDPASATVPGPTLRVTEGDLVRVTLRSTFAGFNHTIHWHGQHVPSDMDGVAYMSQPPVEADEEFEYVFIAKPAGTYWYHCHVDAQHHIDMGMYGALIVDPQDPSKDPHADQDIVIMLDEMDRYHLEGGQPVGNNLPQGGDLYSTETYVKRQANDVVTRNTQVNDALAQANTPVRPNRDWYPVTYPPYTADYNTFLINGVAFPYTESIIGKEGQVLRIRMINAGNVLFAMHLHGHHVLVTHKDGILLESPYWADTVPIAPGERYDVFVRLNNPGLWDFHDHIGGHTQNDNIFPGGAMTMLCYEGYHGCEPRGHGGHNGHSGHLIRWTGHELA